MSDRPRYSASRAAQAMGSPARTDRGQVPAVLLPDHYGCDLHDPEDFVVYQYKSGRVEKRCLACRRERHNATHNNGDRCRKAGHLKTPFTWRYYGPRRFGRCLTCQYARQKEKRTTNAEAT